VNSTGAVGADDRDPDGLGVLGRGDGPDGEADALAEGVSGFGVGAGLPPLGMAPGRGVAGPVPIPPGPPIANSSATRAIPAATSQTSCQVTCRRQGNTPC
jgi:hypothetical protein